MDTLIKISPLLYSDVLVCARLCQYINPITPFNITIGSMINNPLRPSSGIPYFTAAAMNPSANSVMPPAAIRYTGISAITADGFQYSYSRKLPVTTTVTKNQPKKLPRGTP